METTLYHGDSLDILQNIKDKVDAIITDPPYNISRETHFHRKKEHLGPAMDFGEWDKNFDIRKYIPSIASICKENANVVIFNSWQNLRTISDCCEENHIFIKRCLILNKTNPVPFNRDRMFVNDVEFGLWGVYNSKNKPKGWTFNRENLFEKCVINCVLQHRKYHPTAKDPTIIEKLIRLLTNSGDVILDPFMGSGTTGICAKKLNRSFIGVEIDEKYYNIAKNRIEGVVDGLVDKFN